MSEEAASYRRIMRSTSIVGGAAAVGIVVGLARMKGYALLVGPAGVGLIGLLVTVISTAPTVLGLGISQSGVRHIAAHADSPERVAEVRAGFWGLTLLLAVLAAATIVALRAPIADLLGAGAGAAEAVGWLSVGVAAAIVAGSANADIQAAQRVGDLARAGVLGAVLGTALGLAILASFGRDGLAGAVIAAPLAVLAGSALYARRLPRVQWRTVRRKPMLRDWGALVSLGTTLVVSGFVGLAMQVALRGGIARASGLAEAGLFQAAWGISVTNLGLLLNAMGADFFPRLSAVASDPARAGALVNQQLRVALLLGGPLLAAMASAAPLVLHALYTAAFTPAAGLLRWLLAGDVLKLAAYPLGYLLIARGDKGAFLAIEIGFAATAIVLFRALQGRLGLDAAGLAYAVAFLAYVAASVLIARRRHGVAVERAHLAEIALLLTLLGGVALVSRWSGPAAAALGALAAGALGWRNYRALTAILPGFGAARLLARARGRR